MQGTTVAGRSEMPIGEVARGRSFIGCDTTTEQLRKDEQWQLLRYPRSIPDPNPSDIPSSTLVLPTKTLLCHHFLKDFVSALYATGGIGHLPHLRLRALGLGFPKHRFRVTITM